MISKTEVKKLAELARIDLTEMEEERLAHEMGAILDYVGQIKSVVGEAADKKTALEIYNILREDQNPTESGAHSKELIAEFPDKQGDYLKVKKIL